MFYCLLLGIAYLGVVIGYRGYPWYGYPRHQGYHRYQGYSRFQQHRDGAYQYNRGMMVPQAPPTPSRYRPPTVYPCMQDWNKICHKHSECCSGACMTTFCKVQGIEAYFASNSRGVRTTPTLRSVYCLAYVIYYMCRWHMD